MPDCRVSWLATLRMAFASLTFRFMLRYVIGLSGVVFLVMVALYASYSYNYFADSEKLIESQLNELADRYERTGSLGQVELSSNSLLGSATHYLLVDAQGHKVAGNIDVWPTGLLNSWIQVQRAGPLKGFSPETAIQLGLARELPSGYRLLVVRDYTAILAIERIIGVVMARIMLATVFLGALGGLVVAGRSMHSVLQINQSITRIISGDLSERIPVTESRGDFRLLTLHFNQLLDRLQTLIESMRQVTDNIAHDLRTPLTRIRNHLAELQKDAPPPMSDTVHTLLVEADALLVTFNALLRIAQVESGQRRSGFRSVDLQVILADLVELYEPLASEKRQSIIARIDEPLPLQGDRDLLFQAFANLLDNAIKYTPLDGVIRLRAWCESDGWIAVELVDSGSGIPDADREKVFRRFYRVEASRGTHPGNGLGLSLVKAVMSLHQAQISLGDGAPGLAVLVRLPQQV